MGKVKLLTAQKTKDTIDSMMQDIENQEFNCGMLATLMTDLLDLA